MLTLGVIIIALALTSSALFSCMTAQHLQLWYSIQYHLKTWKEPSREGNFMYIIFGMVSLASPQFVCVMPGLLPSFLLRWYVARSISQQTSQLHWKWWFIYSVWTCCKVAALNRGLPRALWVVSWLVCLGLEAASCKRWRLPQKCYQSCS